MGRVAEKLVDVEAERASPPVRVSLPPRAKSMIDTPASPKRKLSSSSVPMRTWCLPFCERESVPLVSPKSVAMVDLPNGLVVRPLSRSSVPQEVAHGSGSSGPRLRARHSIRLPAGGGHITRHNKNVQLAHNITSRVTRYNDNQAAPRPKAECPPWLAGSPFQKIEAPMSDLSPQSAPKRTLITLLSPIAIYEYTPSQC